MAAEADPPMTTTCCLSRAQGPAQACLRPGVWLPGARRLHRATERWHVQLPAEELWERIQSGVAAIAQQEHLEVHRADKEHYFMEIFSYTPGCNWLDVVEIKLHSAAEDNAVTYADAVSFSSGLIPACCPLAFLFNACCFCAPFSGNGFNTNRLKAIRSSLLPSTEVAVTEEVKCNCCPS